ncbi:tolloid-like protein 2 [Leptotrombidium deliense]|uniref:Metalloendopeptidase n=1 Tax=Leptotrombidium deliense TaxID=299467 RepID=A0A443SJI6_9ACAR|nr:tolloid-like protein 2 [Leptotrombidium deliense]
MQYLLINITEIQRTKKRPVITLIWSNDYCGIENKAGWKGKNANHRIFIAKDCEHTAAVAHMLLHVLGFPHEINHPDRDQYVHILKPGLAEEDRKHYVKYNRTGNILGHTYGFDKFSVMNYYYDEFRDTEILPVIVPLRNDLSPYDFGRADLFEQEAARKILSYKDVEKLKEFYALFEPGSSIDIKNLVNDSVPHGREATDDWDGSDPNDNPNNDGIIPTIVDNGKNNYDYSGCRKSLRGKNNQTF